MARTVARLPAPVVGLTSPLCYHVERWIRFRPSMRDITKDFRLVTDDAKTCRNCGVDKNVAEFDPHPTSLDGFRLDCRDCVAELATERERRRAEEAQLREERRQQWQLERERKAWEWTYVPDGFRQGRPVKLADGSWGVYVRGVPTPSVGDPIFVRTRTNKTWEASVTRVVRSVDPSDQPPMSIVVTETEYQRARRLATGT